MKKKKGRASTILLGLVFIAGLSLLLYPTVSNYWNSMHQTKAINNYVKSVNAISEEKYGEIMDAARVYNSGIPNRVNPFRQTDEEKNSYLSILDVGENGVMGYIEIPSIKVSLPIYHGTDDSVLAIGVGHLDWTSLPTGGESTHCVLSGHRGLPSAKLFTNLDKVAEGDIFMLRILGDVLTYQVDQILTVLPENTDALQLVRGEDYCTLVTCTPYGINTHRLLVRGHRIENIEESEQIHLVADAVQMDTLVVACAIGIPVLFMIFMFMFSGTGGQKKKRKKNKDKETNQE